MLPDFFRFVKDPVQRTERITLQTLASRTNVFCFLSLAGNSLVEDDGFEPTTLCLQSRCSPS